MYWCGGGLRITSGAQHDPLESFLSFLGLGTQEPLSSWGALLSDGANSMEVSPWLLLFPAGFLVVTLFCFNFIGDGLRDALDPKDR